MDTRLNDRPQLADSSIEIEYTGQLRLSHCVCITEPGIKWGSRRFMLLAPDERNK